MNFIISGLANVNIGYFANYKNCNTNFVLLHFSKGERVKHKHLLRIKFIIIAIVFMLSIPATLSSTVKAASAEKGEWVAYPLTTPIGAGSTYAACGEDCSGYARAQSNSILFFDTNKSAWTEAKFDTQQTVRDLKAEGHTVFAYTDELLIGYSAFTGDYDIIQYVGTLLTSNYQNPSYGCGKNMAFFVTNETMYVFDAELGSWQEYDYGLPTDYSDYSVYVVKDDYIWAVLYREPTGDPKNVVYSLYTHSFNQLENGCYTTYAVLDHGFARWQEHGGENYTLVGYSAFTNEFDIVQVSGQGELCFSNVVASGLKADEITAYAVSFRLVVTPFELVRGEFYGFDTRRGFWSHSTVDFDYLDGERYSGAGSWQHGGQFVIDLSILTGEIYRFIFYSGITGQFSISVPGLTYDSVTSATPCGGEVLVVYDIDDAWGYSFTTGEGSTISLDKPYTTGFPLCGDDFIVFSRYDETSETMTMYIYNGQTNEWTATDFPKQVFLGSYTSNEHIFVISSDNSNSETIFYSSFIDTYVKRDFPADSYVGQNIGYALAWATSSQKSYLFDAQRGTIHEFNFEFAQNGLGDYAASFYNNKTLYGYSALSGQWTNTTVDDSPYTCLAKGFIGLVSTRNNTAYYNKYYVFNSLKDSWVELIPVGTHQTSKVGEKTALVVRSNMLYAFDPNGRSGTYKYWIEFEGDFFPISISTNSTIYNFSFNQSSKEINFNVTGLDGSVGFCNLTLPNTLVQNLWQSTFTVLVDGEPPMQIGNWTDGTYTYVFFTYVHSEHEVELIPELPPLIIMPLLMTLTLLAALIHYKQHLTRVSTSAKRKLQ
jgi:hypothetical protein